MKDKSLIQDVEDICHSFDSVDSREERIHSQIEFLTDESRHRASELAPILPYKSLFRVYRRSDNVAIRTNIGLILANVSLVPPAPGFRASLGDVLAAAQSPLPSESPKHFHVTLANLVATADDLTSAVGDSIAFLSTTLFTAERDVQIRILDTLTRLASKPPFADFLIGQGIDFDRLLRQVTNETHARVLRLMLLLLPSSRVLEPVGLPKHETASRSHEFALNVQPSLLRMMVDCPIAVNFTLLAFSATLVAHFVPMTDELVMALLSYSATAATSPCVLALLTFFVGRGQDDFCRRILEELERTRPPDPILGWYTAALGHVRGKLPRVAPVDYSSMGLQDFTNAAAHGTLDWFAFLTRGGVDRCRELVEKEGGIDLGPLVDFCTPLLSLCPLPKNHGSSALPEAVRLLLSERTVDVQLPDNTMLQVRAPLYTSVSLIEALINANRFGYDRDRVAAAISQAGLDVLVPLPEQLPSSQLSALCRGLLAEEYPALTLRAGNLQYAIGDTMFAMVCDGFEQRDARRSGQDIPLFVAEPARLESHRQGMPRFRPFQSQFFDPLLEFLSICATHFHLWASNTQFVSRVRERMCFPLNSIGRISPAFALVFQYADLFPYATRALAFKLCALDPLAALGQLAAQFAPQESILLPSQVGITVTVDRARLLPDGRTILRRFAAHKLPLDLRFVGERGHGPGVAREFFALLSQAYRQDTQLWRSETKEGLFPAPRAQQDAFEDIGTLVAKALSMDCLLELPLAPAFVALVRGCEIGLDDVDPELARVLAGEIDGVDFECPGCPEAFSRAGTVVGDHNREEFIAMVEQAIVGTRARECAQAFRRGFERVLSIELLDLFSHDEVVALVAGQTQQFTVNDFELKGYAREDPAVVALDEVIRTFNEAELQAFLRFVTGASHLPVGGPAGLTPPLAVWKMEKDGIAPDGLLPTSAVCVNALKLPPYSSKELLRSKLLIAMTDGKDSFYLD